MEKQREKHRENHGWVVSYMPPARDLACNPGICADWESNQRPFGSQAGTQSPEPHQPGQGRVFFICLLYDMSFMSRDFSKILKPCRYFC